MATSQPVIIIEEEDEVRAPGRPPLSTVEPTVRKTITITKSYADKIEALGEDGFSSGVRRAVDLAEEKLGKEKEQNEPA